MLATTAIILAAMAADGETILRFERDRIGTGIYEAASAFDVNNDGHMDIVSGEYWYPGPDFKTAHKIGDIPQHDDYYDDFSNYPMDVNGDGYLDIVTGGWWNKTLRWRENPKGEPVAWPVHDVAEVGNIERACFCDIDGDGYEEVIPVTAPIHIFKLRRGAQGRGLGAFDQFTIATKGGGGHGFGCGDVNGNGRMDLVFAGGWMEAPEHPWDLAQWVWHPEFDLGAASVPILVHDVNGDGMNDLIVGSAHDYGLWWYEQGRDADGKRTWARRDIDPHRSQYHDMQLADLDKDGSLELITGKRYRAHAFNDPGSLDPLGLYYFKIRGGKFDRVTLDYGPADRASGAGIYFWVTDITGNGWKDILAPGKEGLYLFRNLGPMEKP